MTFGPWNMDKMNAIDIRIKEVQREARPQVKKVGSSVEELREERHDRFHDSLGRRPPHQAPTVLDLGAARRWDAWADPCPEPLRQP